MFDQKTRGILICQFRNVQLPHLYCMLICLLLSEKTMLTLSLTTEESGTLFKKIKLGIPLGVPTHRLRTTALEHGIIWHLGYRFNSWHTCTRQRKQAFVTAAINVELLIAWVKSVSNAHFQRGDRGDRYAWQCYRACSLSSDPRKLEHPAP